MCLSCIISLHFVMHALNNLHMVLNSFKIVLTLSVILLSHIGFAQDKKLPNPEKSFKHSDKDKNGIITFDEFKNTKRKKELSEEVLQKRFNRMDADKNNELTLDEVKAHFAKIAERRAKKAQ